MCGRDDTDRAPNADGDASSIGELLALPTGEMFRQVGRYLLQPRISIPAFLAATSFLSVALASTLIFAFFTTTDIRILDTSENSDKSSKSILLFGEVLKDLEDGYVDKVDTDTLFQTAAEAMTASLDPYTEFESKTESEDNMIRYNGRYGGVGMGIERDWTVDGKGKQVDRSRFRVSSALEGYAWDVGMRPGDHLVAIDGVRLAGKELRDVTDMLRGEAGTKVKVAFERDGVGGELEAVITRKQVKLRDVPLSTFLGPPSEGVGYVRVQAFAMDTKQEMQNALAKLASLAPEKRLKAIVLDLRGNPGGLLSSAVGVAETFLPERTTIVETRGRISEEAWAAASSAAASPTQLAARQSQPPVQPPGLLDSLAPPTDAREPDGADWRYTSTRPPLIDPSVRVVVLTDGRSASASEIVAGAMQDLDRGIIVGERTFGKGLVQQVVSLPYDTALKMTIARYYTPSGRCIQAVDYKKQRQERVDAQGAAIKDKEAPVPGLELPYDDPADAGKEGEGAQRRSFTTLVKHRTVREGGGIEPDVSLPAPQPSEIEIQLQDQETYENFASFWQRSHPLALAAPSKEAKEAPKGVVVGAQPAPPSGSMAVDDTVFNAFLDFVERKGDSGFEARTRFDPYLKQLAAAMKKEGLEDMAAKTQVLTQSAQSTLRQDMLAHAGGIKRRLQEALLTRQEPESLRLARSLLDDDVAQQAGKLAQDDALYNSLLQEGVVVNGAPNKR